LTSVRGLAVALVAFAVRLAVLGAAFLAARAGLPGLTLLAVGRAGAACLGLRRFAAVLAVFARVPADRAGRGGVRFLREVFADEGRVEARAELRFGRLARLPVGRFLAMSV
jgi:hypothetical protein